MGRVDIDMKRDEEDGNSDSDESIDNQKNDGDCVREEENGGKKKKADREKGPMGKDGSEDDEQSAIASEPMIQIQFALTDPNNPMMELLANDDKEEEEEDDEEKVLGGGSTKDDDEETDGKVQAVKSLLESATGTPKRTAPAIRILNADRPAPAKPLITELS